MLLELTLAILAILIAWDYFHKKQTDAFLAKSNISGPKAVPILGNALRLRNVNTESEYRRPSGRIIPHELMLVLCACIIFQT